MYYNAHIHTERLNTYRLLEQMHNLTKNVKALIATIDGVLRDDGTFNVTRAAKLLGLGQTTLLRILRDESKQARPSTEEKLIKFFGISKDDLYADNFDPNNKDDKVLKTLNEINSWSTLDRVRMYEALGIDIDLNDAAKTLKLQK